MWLILSLIGLGHAAKSVGWVYVADPTQQRWEGLAFEAMDLMVVGPLGLQQCDWTPHRQSVFPYRPLFNCEASFGVNASFLDRFEHLLALARQRNPNLEVMAAQWYASDWEAPLESWGGSLGVYGPDIASEQLEGYASTVSAFLHRYNLTGYVLDYEGTNVLRWYPELLRQLLRVFRDRSGPHRLGVSPSTAQHLRGTNHLTDFVFLQSYTPGVDLQEYLDIFDASKVFLGMCRFGCDAHGSLPSAAREVQAKHLAGIHLWRLNDGDEGRMAEENELMRKVRTHLTPLGRRRRAELPSGFFNLVDAFPAASAPTNWSGEK
ncbi:Chitinase, partial [Durusdinium trenchii]